METLAIWLFLFSMIGIIIFSIALIIHKIRKKTKNKIYFRGLLISIIVFIGSIILFGVFETPETKARTEQQRIERQKEKEAQALANEQNSEEPQEANDKQAEEKEQEQTNEEAQDVASTETQTSIEEQLQKDIETVISEDNLELFNYVPANNYALIKFKGSENVTANMTVKGMYMDISNVLKAIQNDIDVNVDVNVTYPLQDVYGNLSDYTVIKATFNNETIKKINFDNFDYNDIPSIADEWWNHDAHN